MAQLDHILQAFNVYVEGYPKLGSGEKANTPKFKKKTEDFRGGGMLAAKKHVLGYEPFEFDFDLNSYDPQVVAQCGLFSKNAVTVSFTAALDGEKNAQHTYSLITRGKFTEIDPGQWEGGKKAMLKCKGALDALKLTYDNNVIYDIDIDADKYVIDGVDEYAWIRAAL